ncbi:MAG TPA: hypothetical protein VK581_02220 [Chthoniobacterales bacterium]|nr:hypothetical protein [Chthoniobacterales bacterium]
MAEERVGKKPELEGETGTENPIADTSEVGGRGRQLLYKCYHDGAENYVQIWGNGYFLCFKLQVSGSRSSTLPSMRAHSRIAYEAGRR